MKNLNDLIQEQLDDSQASRTTAKEQVLEVLKQVGGYHSPLFGEFGPKVMEIQGTTPSVVERGLRFVMQSDKFQAAKSALETAGFKVMDRGVTSLKRAGDRLGTAVYIEN